MSDSLGAGFLLTQSDLVELIKNAEEF